MGWAGVVNPRLRPRRCVMFWSEETAVFLFQMVVIISPVIIYFGYCTGLLIRERARRWAVRQRLFGLCKEVER